MKPVTMLRRGKETWAEGERLVTLHLWRAPQDGCLMQVGQRGREDSERSLPTVSVGRTDGEARLGFIIEDIEGERVIDFTLSTYQVKMLHQFCEYQIPRLKKKAVK